MNLLFNFYLFSALISFVSLEILSIICCNEENKELKSSAYSISHCRIILFAIFFPLPILVITLGLIVERLYTFFKTGGYSDGC